MKVEKQNLEDIRANIGNKSLELEFSEENIFWELHYMTEVLTDVCNWNKNINITNKVSQREKFREALEQDIKWTPDFEFKDTEFDEEVLMQNLEKCRKAVNKISEQHLKKHDVQKLKTSEFQEFFRDIFRELELYALLASNIEDHETWREYSEEIWPMISESRYRNSLEEIRELENNENTKSVDPDELKEMFENEIKNLGFDYNVEIREVGGCYNIPEEQTLVVAKGVETERMYSREEAEMLTKHEVFHVVRGVNGRKASENSFPPILSTHTPFYDTAEEGGALHREQETGTNYEAKDFDYHLRLIAAYKISNGQDFHSVIKDLMDLGGSLERSFYLVARNREALRHHIYLQGLNDWEDGQEKMLVGKVNSIWAEKIWREVEANGIFGKPFINENELFNSR